MNHDDVLDAWERRHGALTDAQRQQLRLSPEVEALVRLNDAAVEHCIANSEDLDGVAQLAERVSWWFDGEPCEPDAISYCARCKPTSLPAVVFITEGWSNAFHRSKDCKALADGQWTVQQRGGQPAPVVGVALQVARGQNKEPCLICFGRG